MGPCSLGTRYAFVRNCPHDLRDGSSALLSSQSQLSLPGVQAAPSAARAAQAPGILSTWLSRHSPPDAFSIGARDGARCLRERIARRGKAQGSQVLGLDQGQRQPARDMAAKESWGVAEARELRRFPAIAGSSRQQPPTEQGAPELANG
jgi:hypothetical protein